MSNPSFAARLPGALIVLRALLAPTIFGVSRVSGTRWPLAALLSAAVLSDIFDGVIARRLGVATKALRVADSRVDAWYFAWIVAAMAVGQPAIMRLYAPLIGVLVILLGVNYAFDLAKFGRLASYHAYSSKLYGLSLFAASVGVLAFGDGRLLWLAFACGVVRQADGLAISATLPEWRHDVAGFWASRRIRREADAVAVSKSV